MRDSNGRFASGNKGRPRGATNKVSGQRKNKINELLQKIEDEHLEDDLAKLTPRDRTTLYTTLLEYVLPKLSRVEREPTELEEIIAMSPEERKAEIVKLRDELKNAG